MLLKVISKHGACKIYRNLIAARHLLNDYMTQWMLFFKARIDRKRKADDCKSALQTLRDTNIADVSNFLNSDELLILLMIKYGFSAVELGRYAINNWPPTNLCPKKNKESMGILSLVTSAGVPSNEAEQFVTLLNSCDSFLRYCPSADTVLTPPELLINGGCLSCGSVLETHNQGVAVTVFTVNGPIKAIKVTWRCHGCKVNYNYAQYGNKETGYRFYKDTRPLIEASNVTYVQRLVCQYHLHLANHAWVSFEGFAEAYNCATIRKEQSHESGLDRRTVASAFYLHEVEEELRSRDMINWVFKGNEDEKLDSAMEHIDHLRCSELYTHTDEECSDDCRKRGCDKFVSMDGIWKLRFPHCMYPVKSEVFGLPVNFPDVCPKEPMTRNSAFCADHCQVAKEHNVPTELRAFLHDYCGVKRYNNKIGDDSTAHADPASTTDVEKVENKRSKLPTTTTHSAIEVTQVQGTTKFITANRGLLSVKMDAMDKSKEVCNKDTGDNQKTLQKWSRGLLHYVRGGGHIDRWNPLFKSESTGQVFLLTLHYLYERLKNVPEKEWENFVLSYDNMCNLCNLRAAKQALPLPKPYDELWHKIKKVIDRLHLRNHKNPRCHTEYSAEPLKEDNPHLNTMVAEQTFVWASRFKKILNAMPMRRFLFYYHRMVVHRNNYTSLCHKNKKTPLLPKVR